MKKVKLITEDLEKKNEMIIKEIDNIINMKNENNNTIVKVLSIETKIRRVKNVIIILRLSIIFINLFMFFITSTYI